MDKKNFAREVIYRNSRIDENTKTINRLMTYAEWGKFLINGGDKEHDGTPFIGTPVGNSKGLEQDVQYYCYGCYQLTEAGYKSRNYDKVVPVFIDYEREEIIDELIKKLDDLQLLLSKLKSA